MTVLTIHPNGDAAPMATTTLADAPRVLSALTGRDEATCSALLGRRYFRANPTTGLRGVYIAPRKGGKGVVVRESQTADRTGRSVRSV